MSTSRRHQLGNGRFELRRGLGEGGYGVVYEAHDRVLDMRVALKQLHRVGPDALLRFKREFRALADLRHDNVVRLYELFEREGQWYFTMELVEGTDFCSWVRDTRRDAGFDEVRLRSGLAELAEGLRAIHRAGLVHRDIKPANVRVTAEGRVVVLDFGLVLDEDSRRYQESQVIGTVDYMAPEQTDQTAITVAADWYAVGVILYEALTGQLPFYGSGIEVLLRKKNQLPPRPRERSPYVPEDLDELCMSLLATEPQKRADGRSVLSSVRGVTDSMPAAPVGGALDASEEPEGREAELAALSEALAHVQRGSIRASVLEGESGLGKSTLMHCFARRIEEQEERALVFRSTCYERESVAYKALDGIIDSLAAHLSSLPAGELPPEAAPLCRAFPVLDRVFQHTVVDMRPFADPSAQRRQIVEAFFAILRHLAATARVVLCIDDLQWADADSLSLLDALLKDDTAPAVLIVATSRPVSATDGSHVALRQLLSRPACRRIPLTGITSSAARALLERIVGALLGEAQLELIVRESEGHPMFLAELAREALETAPVEGRVLTLDQAILRRVARASFAARTVVELLSVAAAPLSKIAVREALSIPGEELMLGLSELAAQKLVRTSSRGELECYHDRVRETVAQSLDPQTRASYDGRLARVLETHAPELSARIAAHWLGAGEGRRAIPWLERAAVRAEEKLAFGRAAELYANLLALAEQADAPRVHEWRVRRGDALANAGRIADAAREYLGALEGAKAAQAMELRQRAAQALFQAGEVQQGLEVMRVVFRDGRLAFAETTNRAFLRLGWHRMCLKLTRANVAPAPDAAVSAAQRAQLDLLFGLAPALSWIDMVRGIELQCRHFRLALRARDARHMALAMAYEGALLGASSMDGAKADAALARAHELATELDDPYVHAVVAASRGLLLFFRIKLREARVSFETAERLFREQCVGATWHLGVVRTNLLTTLLLSGENGEHVARATAWLRDAQDRGDSLAYTSLLVLGGGYNRLSLHQGTETAEAEVDEWMLRWPAQPFSSQHLGHIIAKVNLMRTRGGSEAHQYIEKRWHEIESSIIGRSSFTKGAILPIRADAAIDAAIHAKGDERERLLAHAAKQLKVLSTLESPGARQRAELLAVQLTALRGNREAATVQLEKLLSTQTETEAELALEWAAAEYLLGVLLGGDRGRERKARAIDWAERRGFPDYRVPMRITAPVLIELDP